MTTTYNEYVGEAMQLHASGYIERPVTAERVRQELDDLRHPVISQQSDALLRVACFGSFEVYTQNGAALHFERAKKCFAYLISRRGAKLAIILRIDQAIRAIFYTLNSSKRTGEKI